MVTIVPFSLEYRSNRTPGLIWLWSTGEFRFLPALPAVSVSNLEVALDTLSVATAPETSYHKGRTSSTE